MDKIKLVIVVVIAVVVGYAIPRSPSPEVDESDREVHLRKYRAAPVAPTPVKPTIPVAEPAQPRSAEFDDLLEQPSIFAMLHLAYDMVPRRGDVDSHRHRRAQKRQDRRTRPDRLADDAQAARRAALEAV